MAGPTPPPEDSVYSSSSSLGVLSSRDANLYLARIGLPATTLSLPPSLTLLRDLQLRHLLHVPFESTALHILDSQLEGTEDDADIVIGGGAPLPLGKEAFERIVLRRRGGYCFTLNSTFAAFLRVFGFRVSEVAAKVYQHLGKDPDEMGLSWSGTSHECLIIDWDGSQGQRWFVDVGFGVGQCPHPILLKDEATSDSITPSDSFVLRLTPGIPLSPSAASHYPDPLPHFTLHRKVSKSPESSYFTPIYTFPLFTVPSSDLIAYNHYNSTHSSATFVKFLVATILLKDGRRINMHYKEGMEKEGMAKVSTTASGSYMSSEEKKEEVEWIEMKVGPMRKVLREKFGFDV